MDIEGRIYSYQPLFGSWKIDEEIGAGSFGTVYRVSKEEMGERYESAVKILQVPSKDQYREARDSLGLDPQSLNHYFRDIVKIIVQEVNILHSLAGRDNILNYHDHSVMEHVDHSGWDILIRMEYSTPLPKYLENAIFTREQAVRLGLDITSALMVCRGKGILHRDVKDSNIFVSRDGIFKLGDFGVAKNLDGNASAGTLRGTPLYMAPEVFRGEKYDARIDIYSLGLVLYKLTNNGRMPFLPSFPNAFSASESNAALDMRLAGRAIPVPKRSGVPLGAVILKACAYLPEGRYQSAEEMHQALEEALRGMSEEDKGENLLPSTVTVSAPEPADTVPGRDHQDNPDPLDLEESSPESGLKIPGEGESVIDQTIGLLDSGKLTEANTEPVPQGIASQPEMTVPGFGEAGAIQSQGQSEAGYSTDQSQPLQSEKEVEEYILKEIGEKKRNNESEFRTRIRQSSFFGLSGFFLLLLFFLIVNLYTSRTGNDVMVTFFLLVIISGTLLLIGLSGLIMQKKKMKIYTSTPSHLVTNATSNSIIVKWDPVDGVKKYHIYRRYDMCRPYLLAEVSSPEYKDSSILLGQVYYYQVSSVTNGIESELSQFVRAAIPAVVPNGISKTG